MPTVPRVTFEPEEIIWKYCTLDGESFEKPAGQKIIAPLLLSKDVSDARYKSVASSIIQKGFCVAIPCDAVTREEKLRTNSYEFVSGAFFPLSPAQGASQLISAMNNEIDVMDITGGACMSQKMFLVKDYFRKNQDKTPQKKIKFYGFSDGSSPAIYLGDLLQHIHINSGSGSPQQENEFFAALNWSESDSVKKELVLLNDEARSKYNEEADLSNLKPMTLLVHNQVLSQNINSFEEWHPKSDQKFVLCLEGFSLNSGYSILETLESFFSRFRDLQMLDHLQHLELGEIFSGNAEIAEKTQQAIIALCNEYGVALVAREGQRTGHGNFVFAEPSGVFCKLSFQDGKLFQESPCLDLSAPQAITQNKSATNYGALEPKFRVSKELRPEISIGSADLESSEILQESTIRKLALMPVNKAAEELLEEEKDGAENAAQSVIKNVLGGLPGNAINQEINAEKGLMLVVKSRLNHAFTMPLEYALAAGRIKCEDFDTNRDVAFVIIAGDFEELFAGRKEELQKFVNTNRDFVQKFVALHQVQTPIFYANQQVKGLSNLFEAQIEMQRERPQSISLGTSSQLSAAAQNIFQTK